VTFKVSDGFLFQDVVAVRSGQHLYTVSLMPLFGSEVDLRGGRFTNFTRDAQPHRISLEREFHQKELQYWLGRAVAWIADHCGGSWSLAIDFPCVRRSDFHFSFDSASAAVAFALVWK
jgi:hypothetical protein